MERKDYMDGANRWMDEQSKAPTRETTVQEDTAKEVLLRFFNSRMNESTDVDALQTAIDSVCNECNLDPVQRSQVINTISETIMVIRSAVAQIH